ncbi:hypothetical protein SALBM135S_02398 [Streptomyces alboniger]
MPPIHSGEDAGPLNLHSGDVNGDGKDDLIVDGFSTADDYNANLWLPGSSRGVTTTGVQRLPAATSPMSATRTTTATATSSSA